jgi:hypothetical protein
MLRALLPLASGHLCSVRLRSRLHTSLLLCVLRCPYSRDYYQHVRLLLLCAHTGASAIGCGNLETSGSSLASIAKVGIEKVPGLIGKALGKAAESLPFLGAGATALTALIELADKKSLTQQMHRIRLLARTPEELQHVLNETARKFTVLQWETLTEEALRATLNAYSFSDLVKRQIGLVVTDVQVRVQGQKRSMKKTHSSKQDCASQLGMVLGWQTDNARDEQIESSETMSCKAKPWLIVSH